MNQRQKKKQRRLKNKRLVTRYPFLRPRNRWADKPGPSYRYGYTEWDAMPAGWRKAFGNELLEELREELIRCDYLEQFRIVQLKEKYGSLRLYTGPIPADSKIDQIIDKYEHISAYVCLSCGALDAPIIDNHGWYEPVCKKCWDRQEKAYEKRTSMSEKEYIKIPYEEMVKDCDTLCIPESYTIHTYAPSGVTKETYDISDTVKKIRKKYKNTRNSKKSN